MEEKSGSNDMSARFRESSKRKGEERWPEKKGGPGATI